jgi:hypothetical protein
MTKYDFTSTGITNLQYDINNDDNFKNQVISDLDSNFKTFVGNYFNLTTEQSDLIGSIPDDVTQNIGANLSNALSNGYTISINIGNFSVADPPDPSTTQVSSGITINISHDDQCHWTIGIGVSCSWS